MRVVGSAFVARRRILFGSHVVDRFRERVETGLTFPEARDRLRELIPAGELRRQKPVGIVVNSLRDQILTETWLTFEHGSGLVVFPLVAWPRGLIATTCLTTRKQTAGLAGPGGTRGDEEWKSTAGS